MTRGMVVNTPLVHCYVVGGLLLIRASYWRVWSTIVFFLSAFDQNVQQKKRKRPHTFVFHLRLDWGAISHINSDSVMARLKFDVGSKYKLTYRSGNVVCFQIIGGEPIKIRVFDENGGYKETLEFQSIGMIEDVFTIEEINEK